MTVSTPDRGAARPVDDRIVGTDVLGRPYTAAERRRAARVLRAHGFESARLVALRYAHTKMRSRAGAQDLLGRVLVRLIRLGWDPKEVPLVKRLCRLVYSEWTHEMAERKVEREAIAGFLQRAAGEERMDTMAPDDAGILRAAREDEERAAEARLEALRQAFRQAGDDVNLLWLAYAKEGIETPREMAERSGRDVHEFYRAAERRKRQVQRLIDAGPGPTIKEEVAWRTVEHPARESSGRSSRSRRAKRRSTPRPP